MRPDGGEARRVSDTKEGVSEFAFSDDGRTLVFRSGKSGDAQLYSLPGNLPDEAVAEQITRHPTGVGTWQWAPDSKRIYFVTPDSNDEDEKSRREKKFTVNIRNPETPMSSLWAFDVAARTTKRLTEGGEYSADAFTISKDSRWIGFRGLSKNRYQRGITQENLYSDLYLLEAATGAIERLTNNFEVGESGLSFSPDSTQIAFSAPDDLVNYSMSNNRVYHRAIADKGKPFRKLGESFDGDVSIGFWSKDGSTIYFNEGIKATSQIVSLDVRYNTIRPLTEEKASVSIEEDASTGVLLINYSDGTTPATVFTVDKVADASTRKSWRQLTDPNPQVRGFALGQQEEISWKSKDGTMVGGVLVKPVGYKAGQRYPLIVAIHGGPASADILSFNGGYGSQVYAGAGYVVLRPNYRGSTNYGVKLKTDIVGNYMAPGYDDIIAGVDHLIAQGMADPDRMGALGWSAGGHWSNWILTHTDRFKAISTGAGTSNWISMYAQSDVQRNRQFYLGNKLPYDDFDAYWNQSPLKFIKNAKTPTMIHVVEGDPRVPSPQSVELHMALKQLGVPTELYMYPGNTHGIPDPRNQYVKSVSEMAWMDFYVRGMGKKFAWRDVLKSLEDEAARPKVSTESQPQR
jgi:dipeptidyl aminopeptidase/acylaminoacyl peptidase